MTERFERAFEGDEFSRFVVVRANPTSSSAQHVNGGLSLGEVHHEEDGGEGMNGEDGDGKDECGGEKGEIIGWARWHCFERERSEAEWKEEEKREWPPEVNLGAVHEFFGELGVKRREIMGGRRHYS